VKTLKTLSYNIGIKFHFCNFNAWQWHQSCPVQKNNIAMNIKPIKTEQDYQDALQRIETLWGCKKDTPEGDEFDLLITLVESYEMKHYPIAPPDPVDAIKFRMEQMNMTKADMVKFLGSQSRVSEVLNRKRSLTLKMVKSLYSGLKIPAEILLS
jgi:HTH-type transcriptional regulator / antitoxin HigA